MTPRTQGADFFHQPFYRVWSWWGNLSSIARLSLRREFAAIIPLTALMGVMHLQFCGFVGLKALHMTKGQLLIFMVCIFPGFLLAGPLTGYFQSVRKMRVLAIVLVGVAAVLFTITLTPIQNGSAGVYIFMSQIFLAQIGMAMVFTMRTAIWRANYPFQHRGKIVVLIELFLSVGSSLAILIYTGYLDKYPSLPFQSIYVVGAFCALISAWLFSRIRLRREKIHLRSIKDNPVIKIKLLAGLAVLRKDAKFRKFMSWQMLNGFSTMLIDMGVMAVIMVDVFDSNWIEGGAALVAIPLIATGLSSLLWARYFDSRSIYTIRFYAALTWTLSRLVLIAAIYHHSILIVLISRIIAGIAMGGGKLAWRLGHMQFAPPDQDLVYMGAHVSLTGLRGLLAPVVGILLYQLECKFLGSSGMYLIALSAAGLFTAAFAFRHMRPKTVPKNPA
jgi:MFS family permease